MKLFLKKYIDKNLINQAIDYFIEQNKNKYIINVFNHLKREDKIDLLDCNKLIEQLLRKDRKDEEGLGLVSDILRMLPLKVIFILIIELNYQSMFGADKIWHTYIEDMVSKEKASTVIVVIEKSIFFGTDAGFNKPFYEE